MMILALNDGVYFFFGRIVSDIDNEKECEAVMKITDKMFEHIMNVAKLFNAYCYYTSYGKHKEQKIANMKLAKTYLKLQKRYNWSNIKLGKFFHIVSEMESQTYRNTSGIPWEKDLKECEEYLNSLTKEDIPFTKF